MKTNKRGFTLIELLVVITIIGILASLAVPGITKALNSAKQTGDISNARQLGTILFSIASDDNGNYPGYNGDPVTARSQASTTITLFNSLLSNGDLSDAKILVSKANGTPYTGSYSSAALQAQNIGWDYMTNLNTSSPSLIPLILTRGAVTSGGPATFGSAITLGSNNLWTNQGFIYYSVGNSAQFVKAQGTGASRTVAAFYDANYYTAPTTGNVPAIITAQ